MQPGIGEVFVVVAAIDWVALRWLPAWLVSSVACLQLLLFYLYLKYTYGTFKRLGITSVPPSSLIFGNVMDLSKVMHTRDMEQMAKYGKCYGTFLGTQPELVVSDMDMLKQILVKDFYSFANRRESEYNPEETQNLFANFLSALKDERWKTLRNTITPAFTTGKMNRMTPLVNHCIENVLNVLTETATGETKEFDVQKLFGALTMDVISTCAFATDVNSVRNPDNELVQNAKKLFDFDFASPIMALMFFFPLLMIRVLPKLGLYFFMAAPIKFFEALLSKMIKERRDHPSNAPDFLQLMINAHNDTDADSSSEAGSLFGSSNEAEVRLDKETDTQWGSSKRKLTDMEIMSQSCLFLVAGYHTTAITLTLCSYSLATHPDIQDRCFEELQTAVKDQQPNDGTISFEIVRNRLPYLEAVVLETLRMYPPLTRLDRVCRADCEVNGVKIRKGMVVNVPVHAIHHCAEYYPDPEKFDPERFTPEERAKRNPLTFLPFGSGPRNCVGMRFALLELKLALANILLRFKLKPCAKPEIPLALVSSLLITFEKPIFLAVEKRVNASG